MVAVIFDLYGTLLKLEKDEYGKAIRDTITDPKDLTFATNYAMTQETKHPDDILTALEYDPTNKPLPQMSVTPYEDTITILEKLKERKIPTAIISNLATPFIEPIKELRLDKLVDFAYFSCEQGLKKPDRRVYELTLAKIGAKAQETMMIGDNKKYDCDIPTQFGIHGVHLKRPEMNLEDALREGFTLVQN